MPPWELEFLFVVQLVTCVTRICILIALGATLVPRALDFLLAVYLVICIYSVVWPGYALLSVVAENRPLVAGLPLPFAWMIGWIVATFVVLCAYHVLRGRR